jgi:hypothetical protein
MCIHRFVAVRYLYMANRVLGADGAYLLGTQLGKSPYECRSAASGTFPSNHLMVFDPDQGLPRGERMPPGSPLMAHVTYDVGRNISRNGPRPATQLFAKE